MIQVLHIFRKDARHLWREIAASLALLVAFAWLDIRSWSQPYGAMAGGSLFFLSAQVLPGLVTAMLPVSWIFLIVRVVQGESLVGDRQFWVTRPYDWKQLLVAKALFVVTFVNFPLLLADAFLLARAGFHPAHYIGGLLWMQLIWILVPIPVGRRVSQHHEKRPSDAARASDRFALLDRQFSTLVSNPEVSLFRWLRLTVGVSRDRRHRGCNSHSIFAAKDSAFALADRVCVHCAHFDLSRHPATHFGSSADCARVSISKRYPASRTWTLPPRQQRRQLCPHLQRRSLDHVSTQRFRASGEFVSPTGRNDRNPDEAQWIPLGFWLARKCAVVISRGEDVTRSCFR